MSLWIDCAEWKAELFVKSLTLHSQKHGTILGTDDKDWEEVISNVHHLVYTDPSGSPINGYGSLISGKA